MTQYESWCFLIIILSRLIILGTPDFVRTVESG